MACSRPDEGYATVAATAISLVIAMIAAGLMAVAGAELRAAQADYARARNEALLAGEHLVAAHRLVRSATADRLSWTQNTPAGRVTVLAEDESAKVSLVRAADAIPDETFLALGVAPDRARTLLLGAALAPQEARAALLRSSPSPTWRRCVLSMVSPRGGADALSLTAAAEPLPAPANWRTGQIWRIRIVSAEGWMDDRLVRWVGDERTPAATVDRWFGRADPGEAACELMGDE